MLSQGILRTAWWLVAVVASACASELLMVTMGGTKSHKIPFWELAKGMIRRGHNVTFLSAFPPDFHVQGLEEIAPESLVSYVKSFTDWDLVGARIRGEEPVAPFDIIRYGYEACEALLSDYETRSFLRSRRNFDLIVLDGAYPECALGLVYRLRVPFIYINTVGFYTAPLSISGSPAPYSVTPFFGKAFTDDMGLIDRTLNAAWNLVTVVMHSFMVGVLQGVLRNHFGQKMPHVYDMAKNVSFILQNGHYSVSYPRPYLPNVAEIACIHCKEAKSLNQELEDWISGAGEAGFVYVSMGSSVRAASMPARAQRIFVNALGRLPQRVLWKHEAEYNMTDLPPNIKLSKWLPQQDLLGHPKIRAFVTHGGLLSMYETVYHGVPVVTMPVFCDHDANAAKAELDGYAKRLDLRNLSSDKLYRAIREVIDERKYRAEVKRRQILLRDQKETPLERAVYWTEYVIRHKGAYHLQSPAKDLNYFQYHMLDAFCIVLFSGLMIFILICYVLRVSFKRLIDFIHNKPVHLKKYSQVKQAIKLKKEL
ncbi:2-hydroxyacylsphingosine 1-beta-galactosyltransferase [Eumeta japonica]|uniref:2-hydroxyacylsphingosine 1-beta-galactosyltransferase n=1 Tax=Eumeta variegata TaxID=151549 RepID=A0A4C1VXJ3_EUMVA|nr:2-hydroxyacylsphingosine 1-beta-galactosyltransferase [Eumeta japonica]